MTPPLSSLAAEDERQGLPSFLQALSPLALTEDRELSDRVCAVLKDSSGDKATQLLRVIRWLVGGDSSPSVFQLAVSALGCRVVQAALISANINSGRDLLVNALKPYVLDLYESPHGNHVLAKVIEVIPSSSFGFLIAALASKGMVDVARHRFGCRILERLIEHCDEDDMRNWSMEIIEHAEELSKHKFGNFVIQHLLEFGSLEVRQHIMDRLLQVLPALAMHRSASHVVQSAISHAQQDAVILRALLQSASPSLVEVACNRYGSFVIEQIANLPLYKLLVSEGNTWIQDYFHRDMAKMCGSEFGKRVLMTFGMSAA